LDNLTSLQAVLLGIVQGLTEFLPVSSSGHLVLVPAILGWPAPGLAFDTFLHWGTLVAIVGYFFHDLLAVAGDWLAVVFRRRPATPMSRLGWLLIVGTLPTVVIALLLEPLVERLFVSTFWLGPFFLVTAALLILGELLGKGDKEIEQMTLWEALLIGAAQGLAIAPAISRSGATIAVGLFLGLRRPAAARFSFLLAAPALFGAGLLQLKDMTGAVPWRAVGLGALAAAVSSYVCIRFLLAYLKRGRLYVFAIYCALVGVAALTLSALGWL